MNAHFFCVLNLFFVNSIIIYIACLICRFVLNPHTKLDFIIQTCGLAFIFASVFPLLLGTLHLMDLRIILPMFALTGGCAVFIHLKYLKPNTTTEIVPKPSDYGSNLLKIIIIPFTATSCFLTFAVVFLNAMRYPPEQYDSLYFYLPSVVQWLKNGGIGTWNDANIDVRYYPCGYYLITYWIMYFLKSAYFITFIQPAILILTVITAIGIGKNLSFRTDWLIMFGLFTLTIPFFITTAVIDNNDFGPMYVYVLAIYFFLRFLTDYDYKNLVLCGCATGLGTGMKYSGIYWLATIFFVLLSAILNKQTEKRTKTTWVLGFIVPNIILGGYWYIRNFIETGNPMFPVKLNLFGIPLYIQSDLYSGLNQFYLDAVVAATLLKKPHYLITHAKDWYAMLLGYGGYFLLILAAGYIICNTMMCLKRQKTGLLLNNKKFVFMAVTLISLVFFMSIPSTALIPFAARYGFGVFILMFLSTGFWANNNYAFYATVAVFFLNIIFSIAGYTRYWPYIFLSSAVFAGFSAITARKGYLEKLICFLQVALRKKKVAVGGICIFSLIFFGFVYSVKPFVDKHYYDPDYGYGVLLVNQDLNQGWKWISENTRGDNIGYIDCVYVFALYNIDLSNNIVLLKSNEAESFVRQIYKNSVDYLFFQTMPEYTKDLFSLKFSDKFAPQQQWVENMPDKFELKYKNKGVMIYKVK